MQRIIANLIAHPRTSLLGGLLTLAVLAGLLTMISPVRISISIAADDPAAGAAPAAILPTTTPAPPPTEEPPTATAILIPQPSETSAPPTATHVPLPSETSVPQPSETSVPPPSQTAILIPPPNEEPPHTEEPPDRTTRDDPTPQPTIAVPPTNTPQTILITPQPTAVGTPNVVVTKQASRREVRIGDELSYTLTATNNGTAPAEAVVVTDAMPAPLEIISVVSSQGSASASGQSVTVQVGTLAPGQQAVITITVRVRAAVQPGAISNLAMVFTSTPGDPPGDNTTTTTITILPPEPTVAPPAGAQPPPRAATTTQPQRMPKTADPEEAMRFLMTFLPLILLGLGAGIFGMMLNRSAFRQQVLVAFTQAAPVPPRRRATRAPSAEPVGTEPAAAEPAAAKAVHVGDVTIDLTRSDELYARWQAGASVNDLVDELARHNPKVSKAVLMVAIQNVLTSFIRP